MKSFLVTGGNKGIGLAIVRRILLDIEDSFVYLGSRSVERGNEAVTTLTGEKTEFKDRVQMVEIDVSSVDSITSAVKTVQTDLTTRAKGGVLTGIVNNAGVLGQPLEPMLTVNVWGVYHVTNSFLPLMDVENGRIVNVSSSAGPSFIERCNEEHKKLITNPEVEWSAMEELMKSATADINNFEKIGINKADIKAVGENGYLFYQFSKAIVNALTVILAREHPKLKINACTPGFIKTDMTAAAFGGAESGKTPDEGSISTMHLLTSNDLKGNGWYYGSDAKRSPFHKYRSPEDPEYSD